MKKRNPLILLGMILALTLSACGDPEAQAAGDACQAFFDAYAARDGEAVGDRMQGGGDGLTFSRMQGALAGRMEAEAGSAKVNGEEATVSAEMVSIDVAAVFKGVPQTVESREAALSSLIAAFEAPDVPTREFKVTVKMVKENGEWLVQMTPELSDALLGGYNSLLASMREEAGL